MTSEQLIDVVRRGIAQALSNVHTVTIARITRVHAQAIDCQPVIARVVEGRPVQLPEFVDVPVVNPRGGGSYLAMPLAVGDYALLLICERCFDRWFAGQDGQPPAQARVFDYSDAFALVGITPAAGAVPIPTEATLVGVMRLGTAEPSDWAALAGRVLAELEAIKAQFDAIKTVFDAHNHGSAGAAPPATPFPPAADPASVASQYVKAD